MSGLYIPFNYNPSDTIQTNGSYTVPAGFYALAQCQALNGSPVTVNGIIELGSNRSFSSHSLSGGPQSYTIPSGYIGHVSGSAVGSASRISVDSASICHPSSSIDAIAVNARVNEGSVISIAGVAGVYVSLEPINQKDASGHLWLKEGDVIDGGQKNISLYQV